jgi:hypothetical protein
MTIYKGSQKIGTLYRGGSEIQEDYKGSTLVYQSKLPAGQIVFEQAAPGTYTVTLPKTQNYRLIMVGGGGGGANGGSGHYTNYNAGGGSGGYVEVIVKLDKGSYTVSVGAIGTHGSGSSAGLYYGTAGGIPLHLDLPLEQVKAGVAQSIVADLLVVRAVQILWQLMFSLSRTQLVMQAQQVAGLMMLGVGHLFMVIMVEVKTPMVVMVSLDTSKLLRHKEREKNDGI